MTYIIAEVGGNHDGNFEIANALIQEAKEAGCDAVKFQTYSTEKLVHPDTPALPQAKGYTKQAERFKDLQFNDEQWQDIIDTCKREKIDFLTTCFDLESLEKYAPHMKAIKVASGDLTYKRLLRAAATYGKPVILSTGMSNIEEVRASASFFDPNTLTVMQCVSAYPCPDEHANLGVIKDLQKLFSSVGYSDHTRGITAALVAAGMGCSIIEKHFTYDSDLSHGDHQLSATPGEMEALVYNVRRVEKMLGTNKPDPIEKDNRIKMRRGAYAATDIEIGQVISENDITFIRPATAHDGEVFIGRRSRKKYKPLDVLNG